MKIQLNRAETKDLDGITAFYKYVIENTENMAQYGRWVYGQHPTDEGIKAYVDAGNMYYAGENGRITAAAAITWSQGEEYHPVRWQVDAADDEVSVVHILCVAPDRQKSGYAKEVMGELIALSKEKGKKAVRLDALSCNLPAHRLYERIGFRRCGVQNWYAENTGRIDFFLYEFVL